MVNRLPLIESFYRLFMFLFIRFFFFSAPPTAVVADEENAPAAAEPRGRLGWRREMEWKREQIFGPLWIVEVILCFIFTSNLLSLLSLFEISERQ